MTIPELAAISAFFLLLRISGLVVAKSVGFSFSLGGVFLVVALVLYDIDSQVFQLGVIDDGKHIWLGGVPMGQFLSFKNR